MRFEVYYVTPRGNETRELPSGPDVIIKVNLNKQKNNVHKSDVIVKVNTNKLQWFYKQT